MGKKKSKYPADEWAGIPKSVMESPAFIGLSSPAIRLLLELTFIHTGRNNGDIAFTHATQAERGWSNKRTFTRARNELVTADFIRVIKHGGINRGPTLFALSWIPLCKRATEKCDEGANRSPKRFPLRDNVITILKVQR